MRKWARILSYLGPGIFAIGYTIGTGSVTSMATAGSQMGMRLLWVLFLSCFFTGFLMDAYGRFATVTGETTLHGIRRFLPGGTLLAVLLFMGVTTAQYTCLGGILTLSAGAFAEMATVFFPNCALSPRALTLIIAIGISLTMCALTWVGRYSFFEKVLTFFVALMGLTFVVSLFIVLPGSEGLAQTMLPTIPEKQHDLLMLAAFVGTTMAAPTFVTRPLILHEKKIGVAGTRNQHIDAMVSAFMMFLISGAIMAVAAATIYAMGKPPIVRILDMAETLRPVAGRFAVAMFMVGTVSAGLSSIFPILMVAPLLIGDWRHGKMETRTASFRVITILAAVVALIVPFLGGNPVWVTVAAQISNVFVLPLAVFVIIWLLNTKKVMGERRPGIGYNVVLALAFLFSCCAAWAGICALLG